MTRYAIGVTPVSFSPRKARNLTQLYKLCHSLALTLTNARSYNRPP